MASFAGRLAARPAAKRSSVQRAERQADAAAARVLRGERGVREVGRAPAATPGIASLGAPLPAVLRERLERGFGADLSAVRVHTDAAAADAAEREGARAFTAGRDVFLGREVGADIRAERNVRTVAHEVAHVLQQTGADGPDGQIVARDVAGSSDVDVQREEFADWALKHLDDAPPEYKTIRNAYAGVKEAASEIAEVNKIYGHGFAWATDKDHDQLVARTKTAAFASLTADVKAFYADCLKAVERFDDAAAIVKTLPADTRTAYRSRRAVREAAPRRHVARAARQNAVLHEAVLSDRRARHVPALCVRPGPESSFLRLPTTTNGGRRSEKRIFDEARIRASTANVR